ncbi:asparagine synthase-related protein [Lentisphaerota bacterium WC36G]|nr:hypothetical protein LJT99_10440 [Lentisphaerae bacterium WC36]
MGGFIVNYSDNKIDETHASAEIIKHRGRVWSGALQSEIGTYAISMVQHYNQDSANSTDERIMKYEDGDCFIVFDGVIFNNKELHNILSREGYSFKTDSDEELVLVAYCRWGNKVFKKLNGYFSFVIYHRRKNIIVMGRDRFGVKPLYIYNRNKSLRIASEVKQFTKFDDFRAKVDTSELFHFINQGKVSSNGNTLWNGVNELIPGYFITIRLNDWLPGENLYMQPYYKFQMAHRDKADYFEVVERLQALLNNSITNKISNSNDINVLLSGGLGSAGLAGMTSKILAEKFPNLKLNALSWTWDEIATSQRERLEEIWQFNDLKGKIFNISDNFLFEDIDATILQNDQPFTTPRVLIKWHIINEHKEIIPEAPPVLLHGHGIRELLTGYDQYYLKYLHQQLSSANTVNFIKKLNLYKLNSGSSWGRVLKDFLKSRFATQAAQSQDTFLSEDYNDYFYSNDFSEYDLTADNVLRDGLVLLHDNLHCNDHFSSRQNFSYCYPFLDNKICELALSINPAFKVSSKSNNRLLYDVLQQYVPKSIQNSIYYDVFEHIQSLILKQQNQFSEADTFKAQLELVAELPYVNADALFKEYHDFQVGIKPFNPNWLRMIFIAKWFEVHSISF